MDLEEGHFDDLIARQLFLDIEEIVEEETYLFDGFRNSYHPLGYLDLFG